MSRRIPLDVVDSLRTPLGELDTPERRRRYLVGDFAMAESVQDLQKRYRWDLFWDLPTVVRWGFLDAQHADADTDGPVLDAHIYSALKVLIPDLTGDVL